MDEGVPPTPHFGYNNKDRSTCPPEELLGTTTSQTYQVPKFRLIFHGLILGSQPEVYTPEVLFPLLHIADLIGGSREKRSDIIFEIYILLVSIIHTERQ